MSASHPSEREAPVRPGEELPVDAVTAWLAPHLPGLVGPPRVTQYTGGASNWTYRLEYPATDGAPGADLVLRRPPAGRKAASSHDMGREFKVQRALRPVYPYVPEMVAHCTDASVIGGEFYVMRRVPGVIPRAGLPEGVALDAAGVRRVCLAVLDRLVELHQVDPAKAGLASLGKGPGYARRQVEGWIERYERARTWNVSRFRRVTAWLRRNVPEDSAACVIHNDFRLDNVVLDPANPARVRGILDWEMATIGDPLLDLGGSLAYWVQADDDCIARSTRRQPTHLPGMLTRKEVVRHYLERTGRRLERFAFYEVMGLFRLAAIAQQIYYRYHHGQTRNPAFRRFWIVVNYLDWRCRKVLRGGGIDAHE